MRDYNQVIILTTTASATSLLQHRQLGIFAGEKQPFMNALVAMVTLTVYGKLMMLEPYNYACF
jgi:hypothetical protein